jgi:hypothetical protein
MLNPRVLFIAGVEVALLLLFLCVFLLLHLRGLRQLIAALEARVITLRNSVKSVRFKAGAANRELAAMRAAAPKDYGAYLDGQLAATLSRHQALDPDRDIALDGAADAPVEQQVVALRHALLLAEKESWLAAGGGDTDCDWDILTGQFAPIIRQRGPAAEPAAPAVANSGADAEMLENQKRRIENLEQFKQLYFDTERKWRDASARAESYQQKLLQKGRDLGAGESFEALLAQYGDIYRDFGAALGAQALRQGAPAPAIEIDADKPSVGRIVIANQEEIQRLRNMAVDQHKMILQLRQQLERASTLEEKDLVIGELHKQLERHERFLAESDMCARQLESELERALSELHAVEQKLAAQEHKGARAEGGPEVAQLQDLVGGFTQQSSEMLGAIETLERENARLRKQGDAGAADVALLQNQLAAVRQELLDLQTLHIELEQRYLELQVRAG